MLKVWGKLAIAGTGLIITSVGYLGVTAWWPTSAYLVQSELRSYSLMDWDAYAQIAREIEPPVILSAESGRGAVLVFGSTHSNDPNHPQFTALREEFQAFAPTLSLVEGRPGILFPSFMQPIQTYGESGLVIALSKDIGIETYSWELTRDAEAQLLSASFNPDQVAIYLLLRPFRGSDDPETAEAALQAVIDDRGHRPGIDGVIGDLREFQLAWDREIGPDHDWRGLQGVHNAPGFLREMFESGNDNRDQNLLNILRELTEDGERVFVTVGWSHAVRIDDAVGRLSP